MKTRANVATALLLIALGVWFLVLKGSYRVVEKVFLVASLFYIAYIVSGVLAISGESGWVAQTVCIPSGVYNLKWTHSKDSSVSMGLDAAWLDESHALVNGLVPGRRPTISRMDLTTGVLTPLTQDFTTFIGVSLTTDHQAAVTTHLDVRSGISVGDAKAEKVFSDLVAWEQDHLDLLTRHYDQLREMYWEEARFWPF